MNDFRQSMIKLAHEVPELRKHLLPILSKTAMEFETEEALKKYLEDHPGADKSNHSVKKKDTGIKPPPKVRGQYKDLVDDLKESGDAAHQVELSFSRLRKQRPEITRDHPELRDSFKKLKDLKKRWNEAERWVTTYHGYGFDDLPKKYIDEVKAVGREIKQIAQPFESKLNKFAREVPELRKTAIQSVKSAGLLRGQAAEVAPQVERWLSNDNMDEMDIYRQLSRMFGRVQAHGHNPIRMELPDRSVITLVKPRGLDFWELSDEY